MKSKTAEDNRVTHQEIARYAYLLWQEAGCPHGRDVEFWVKAERILHAGIAASGAATTAPPVRATAAPKKKTGASRKKTATAKVKPAKAAKKKTKPEKAKGANPKKKAVRS